jgi:cell division protease FtsH
MIIKKVIIYSLAFGLAVLLTMINSSLQNKISYIPMGNWVSMLSNETQVLQYANDHCLKNITDSSNNTLICTKYIEPIFTQVNFTDYNITSFSHLNHTHTSGSSVSITWILILLYLVFYLFSSSSGSSNSMIGYIFGSPDVSKDLDSNVTINNFVGCSNIKKDIEKVINHIKHNELYKKYDCELPKGLLLSGPPGCGKTHLVKTIIKTTGINYIFTSGSDINKMFVGSGTLAITNLFARARASKPCLIFIDEADALIRKRSYGMESSTANTEFGSTICKLLSELDSLKTESGILVVFASNMPEEYIDKALIRAGRVDQIIHVSHPTFEERIDLFKMYLGSLLNDSIDLSKLSKLTYGLTGSDIKKVVNSLKITKVHEKTLVLTDKVKPEEFNFEMKVETQDIDKEINKHILGLERDRKINLTNKMLIAYHESGHAIMSFLLKDSILPTKICISITSKTLGYTMYTQDDDDLLLNTSINNLIRQLMILYAGRCAEKIFMNEVTTGAEDDYMKARKILKRLVLNGMLYSEYNFVDSVYETGKVPEYIEKILNKINKYLIDTVSDYLTNYRDVVEGTAKAINEFGSITGDDIKKIFVDLEKESEIQTIDVKHIYDRIIQMND